MNQSADNVMAKIYNEKEGFEAVPSYIEDTGEVNWLVADAMRIEVPVPVIAESVMQLFASRDTTRIADKAIAMMRNGFGGYPFGPDEGIQYERKFGKIENAESDILYRKNQIKILQLSIFNNEVSSRSFVNPLEES